MALDPAKSPPPSRARAIVQRTRGRTHGPATRLMSPSDLGEVLKPFVFLDLFDHEGAPFKGGLHPHSGIATLTYVAEGAVSYIDPDNIKGSLAAGGVEWMQAGRGARQSRPDARLPALDRVAAGTGIGSDHKHLPGP